MMFIPILLVFFVMYLLLKDDINLPGAQNKNPNEILDLRLAKGEISIEEYRNIKEASDEL